MRICQNCGTDTEELYEVVAEDFKEKITAIESGKLTVCKKCNDFCEKRKEKLKNIIESRSIKKRLILAGPGTGKTYTFQKVVKDLKDSNSNAHGILIFTLLKNLADELSKDFSDQTLNTDVKTFHGYCKKLLYDKLGYTGEYYPQIPQLIVDDSLKLNLNFEEKNFHKAFANLDKNNPAFSFFINRTSYYNTIGHDDAVYKVYTHYLNKKEDIPTYDLVIADEYQDFNLLEASFIKIITDDKFVLIAGDDDQALYGFREAQTKFIRDIYHDRNFEKYDLPFSSRCTDVTVSSVNHLISEAKKMPGLLVGRIDEKTFISYWPEKYVFDKKYPSIDVVECSKPDTAMLYIKEQIEKITKDEELKGNEKDIQFLVIGAQTQHRLNRLADYLNKNIDNEIYEIIPKEGKEEISIERGFFLLNNDPESNLGWRIITYLEPPKEINKIIEESYKTNIPIYNLLSEKYKKEYLSKTEKYFAEGKPETKKDDKNTTDKKRVKIKLVTFLGAKGLSALHTFFFEFHNGVIPKSFYGKITDDDIFRCIVSLTRAKRSTSLITFKEYIRTIKRSVYRPSKFLDMLPQQNLRRIKCTISEKKLSCML